LHQEDQAQAVWQYGEHIATKYINLYAVLLWQLDGFYVEMFYNRLDDKIEKIRSFVSTKMLAPYLDQIDITSVLK
jgi:hypothetical protein